MQKLITVTIDIEQLKESAAGEFTISEVQGINGFLEEGWHVAEWEFITSDTEEEKVVLLLVLSDEPTEGVDTTIYEAVYGEDEEDGEQEEEDASTEEEETTVAR